jgi:uncharacterized membrane protein HdeD (DUF308 family)
MMGSAAFLIIYSSVNIAHLKLRKETGGNRYIILTSTLLTLATFILLLYYIARNSLTTLITLIIVLGLCFVAEAVLQKILGRKMVSRNHGTKP